MIEKKREESTRQDHSHPLTGSIREHQHIQHCCAICGKDLQLESSNEYAFSTVIQNRVNICAECRKEHFKYECFF